MATICRSFLAAELSSEDDPADEQIDDADEHDDPGTDGLMSNVVSDEINPDA